VTSVSAGEPPTELADKSTISSARACRTIEMLSAIASRRRDGRSM
jgi:hypothetical protein